MKVFRLRDQLLADAFGIRMASVDAFPSTGPGGVAYGVIEAGGTTVFHRHDESELFVIVKGAGLLEADNREPVPVGPGDLVAIAPFDKHVLRNAGGEKLVFATVYWRDPATALQDRETGEQGKGGDAPCFVFSTPPTPNGDLHLGHLSGPYLGADVFVRFRRMRGKPAYHLTGSDDYQSYVILRARQMGKTPQEVADYYCKEIADTLRLLDVNVDQYTITSHAEGYAQGLKTFFRRMVESGNISRRIDKAAFDPRSGAYLYECDIRGKCPTCGSGTGGNICEECGEPNLAYDLVDPVSGLSGERPVTRTCDRYTIKLDDFADHVTGKLREVKAGARLVALADRVFSRKDFHVPVSHPQNWGIAPDDPELAEQVIWVWPEMSFGFLYGIEALGRITGNDWKALEPADDWRIVHFFGYDNSFYHTLLYPALYRAAFPEWNTQIEYHVNEFYCLEGQKFSTSRRHAVWGKEVLSPETVDCVRYHLCLTRGEAKRTNFSLPALRTTNNELVGEWQRWLQDLGAELRDRYGGIAPDAGDWSIDHTAFLHGLDLRRQQVEAALSSDAFSLNQAAEAVRALVRDAIRFAEANRHLADMPSAKDRHRTTIALQLAAALLLSDVAAPLMPRFCETLRANLGVKSPRQWPGLVALLPAGSPVDLAGRQFFAERIAEGPLSMAMTDAA